MADNIKPQTIVYDKTVKLAPIWRFQGTTLRSYSVIDKNLKTSRIYIGIWYSTTVE